MSAALPQTGRVMVKDEDLCVHCGLCAERCPTAAWDMQKFELLIPLALSTPIAGGDLGHGRRDRRQTARQGERLRHQARQRQRDRIGEREQPADAGDLPDGHPGLGQEPLPVEHPGPADLVRDPRQQGRSRRARARVRPHGRDERADVRAATSPRSARGGYTHLRLVVAARHGADPRGRDVPRRPARRDVQRRVPRAARAHPDEEHRVRRRARGAARHRHGRRSRSCSPSSSPARSGCATPTRRRSGSATTSRWRTSPARCRSVSRRWTRRTDRSSSTATPPPRSAACTPARPSRRGIRSRRRRR